MPGDFRCLRCEHSCAYFTTQRARGCGCTGHPAFPTPSVFKGRKGYGKISGASRREARTRVRDRGGRVRNHPRLKEMRTCSSVEWLERPTPIVSLDAIVRNCLEIPGRLLTFSGARTISTALGPSGLLVLNWMWNDWNDTIERRPR